MAREFEWTDAIEGIELTEQDASYDVEMPKGSSFLAASKVTLFVGANNVGKSRFMRHVATSKGLTIKATEVGWQGDVRGPIREISSVLGELFNLGSRVFNEPFQSTFPGDHWFMANAEQDWTAQVDRHRKNFYSMSCDSRIQFAAPVAQLNITDIDGLFRQISNGRISEVIGSVDGAARIQTLVRRIPMYKPLPLPARTYVPVLRGLRSVDREGDSKRYGNSFAYATNQDYGLAGVTSETGLDLFNDVRMKLLGKRSERESIKDYEDFLSRNFFEGRRLTLTPHEKEQVLYIDLDGDEHPIHHVGDGMQSVIVLTYRAFVTRDTPGMFFIEEPELFLHPGMQRRLLHYFLHETPHLYFITTHSNHLLELSMDERRITVHNFRRVTKTTPASQGSPVTVTEVRRVNGGDRSSLALLGVRVSSVFLVNATVWVEGVTDRRYLREMIRLYVEAHERDAGFRRMEEDIHFSFVEYGGSNITHFSFLRHKDEDHPIDVKRLCGNGILMIDADDSDKPGTAKHGRRQELEGALGDRLIVTAGREVENMLPERVVRAVMKQYRETDASCAQVTRTGYRDRLLGAYIDEQLAGSGKRKKWQEGSGTINDKVDFCERAIGVMRESGFGFSELPDEVQKIVERIYAFIQKQNEGGAAAG